MYYVRPGESRVSTGVAFSASQGVEVGPATATPGILAGGWIVTLGRTEVHTSNKFHLTFDMASNGAISNYTLLRYPFTDACDFNNPIAQADLTSSLVYTES